jgi:hypothetical protein
LTRCHQYMLLADHDPVDRCSRRQPGVLHRFI